MKYDLSKYEDVQKSTLRFTKLKESKAICELTEVKNKRTLPQNAYLHVCISIFAVEIGYTLDEAKTHLKRKCSFMRYEKAGELFLKHTRFLTTKELTDFIEWIRNYAGQRGIEIPSPEDYLADRVRIDNYIDECSGFL